jgi:hypothetical protein
MYSPSTAFLALIKNAGTIKFIDVHNNVFIRLNRLLNQVAGGTDGTYVKIRDNYITTTQGILTLIAATTIEFIGNVGDISANKTAFSINASGKQIKVYSRDNKLTFNSGSNFIVPTSGEIISMFGTDIPIALGTLTRTVPGQMVMAAASVGTVLINEVVINDTTNTTGSWHQVSNPALVY